MNVDQRKLCTICGHDLGITQTDAAGSPCNGDDAVFDLEKLLCLHQPILFIL